MKEPLENDYNDGKFLSFYYNGKGKSFVIFSLKFNPRILKQQNRSDVRMIALQATENLA